MLEEWANAKANGAKIFDLKSLKLEMIELHFSYTVFLYYHITPCILTFCHSPYRCLSL